MTVELALPTTADSSKWTEDEQAIIEAAGLVRITNRETGKKALADKPFVAAFLGQCRRTGLDPIARQIIATYRGGKWTIQITVDAARIVAQRTGEYEGQTPKLWSDDGVHWVEAWMPSEGHEHPMFAKAGVYRKGFREALVAVARWDSYAVVEDEWATVNGQRRKTGNRVLGSFWAKMPDLMLAKVAEMLALRQAFPMDLSGLYSAEEMGQADNPKPEGRAEARSVGVDWLAKASLCKTKEALRLLRAEIRRSGALTESLDEALIGIAQNLPENEDPVQIVDAEVVETVNVETGELSSVEPDPEYDDDAWLAGSAALEGTFARLSTGSWGVRVEDGEPAPGATVTVIKKSGEMSQEVLGDYHEAPQTGAGTLWGLVEK